MAKWIVCRFSSSNERQHADGLAIADLSVLAADALFVAASLNLLADGISFVSLGAVFRQNRQFHLGLIVHSNVLATCKCSMQSNPFLSALFANSEQQTKPKRIDSNAEISYAKLCRCTFTSYVFAEAQKVAWTITGVTAKVKIGTAQPPAESAMNFNIQMCFTFLSIRHSTFVIFFSSSLSFSFTSHTRRIILYSQ